MRIEEKDALLKMYQVCDLVANTSGVKEKLGLDDEIKLEDALKMDLIRYLAYMAASDGVISWNESRYIGNLFDIYMTPDKLNNFIIENDIYSTEFEQKTPMMLQLFVAFDNAVYNSPIAADFSEELSDGLLKLYILLGKGLIESNDRSVDNMDNGEEENLKIYLNMIQNYIDENTEKHHTDIITGYEKKQDSNHTGGVIAPKKDSKANGSVKAPRKKM